MYLNQFKQNKSDSINNNNCDSSKSNKTDDGNAIIIMIIISNLFQSGDFSAESTAAINILASPKT